MKGVFQRGTGGVERGVVRGVVPGDVKRLMLVGDMTPDMALTGLMLEYVKSCETGGAEVVGGGELSPSSRRSGGETSGRIDPPLPPPLLPAAECGGETGPGETLPL